MKFLNKSELDILDIKDRYMPYVYKAIFFIGSLALLFWSYDFFEQKKVRYQNSLKVYVTATFKSVGSSKNGTFCFFEIENHGVIPVRCSNSSYTAGQKVKLIKITQPSGNVYFEVPHIPYS